jgi:hypothetical protein
MNRLETPNTPIPVRPDVSPGEDAPLSAVTLAKCSTLFWGPSKDHGPIWEFLGFQAA